ncbi:MAG: hypothetical protein LBQ35_05700 [Spirochaetaceae bacterium]|jgi:hypothetical protein|nr:hypothetical protein [Spirochaetaceae bacterium]
MKKKEEFNHEGHKGHEGKKKEEFQPRKDTKKEARNKEFNHFSAMEPGKSRPHGQKRGISGKKSVFFAVGNEAK